MTRGGPLASDRVGTPFSRRDWPQSGDPVGVNVTDGSNTHRIFTGNVDGTDSSFGAPDVSVKLVDHTDRLSAQVSQNALFRTMPPLSTTGDERPRMTGLTTAYLTTMLAREAGYYMTPPRQNYILISAPLTGSTWPERGQLWQSGRSGDIDQYHRYQPATTNPSGSGAVWASDVWAVYKTDAYGSPWTGSITTDRHLHLTLGAGPTQASSSYAELRWNTSYEFRIAVTSSRTITVQHRNAGSTSTWTTLHQANPTGWRYVQVTLDKRTDDTLHLRVVTDNAYSWAGVIPVIDPAVYNRQFEYLTVVAPEGCQIHGVQVSAHSGDGVVPGFVPNFTAEIDYVSSLQVLPALVSEPAGDLLHQQAVAECAALWLDEDGVLRWHGRRKLTEQPVQLTLSSSQIADARITMDAQDVRSRVSVKYQAWATSVTTRSRLIVYEGSKDELTTGDPVLETIITPPSDEQWVQVDTNPRVVQGGQGASLLNNGEGSFIGGTVLTPNGDEFSDSAWTDFTWTFGPIGPGAWKSTMVVDRLPSTADRFRTATRSEESTWIKPSYRGLGLPLLRAMGKATSTGAEYVSPLRGPSWAPQLVHDVGWLIQHETRIQGVADFMAAELANPAPRISDLEVLPNPRLQLGDKIRVEETARTGLEIVGVITGVTQSVGPGEHSMSLELMVLSVVASGVTVGEMTAWYDGMTVGEVTAKFAGETVGQHDTHPLRS